MIQGIKILLLVGPIFCQFLFNGEAEKNRQNHLKEEVIMNTLNHIQKEDDKPVLETETQVLIDKFFVPKEAKSEFVTRMKLNRDFIQRLPGFIEDNVYEHIDKSGNFVYVTVAKWKSPTALQKAKEAVQQEYKRINFSPTEMLNRLHIRLEREIYSEFED
jgi:heme-degrading monooxygenase HmoA